MAVTVRDVGRSPSGREHVGLSPDLAWLAAAVWPDADVRVDAGSAPVGFRPAESFQVIPSVARPRFLVPAWDPPLIRPALLRFHDGMSAGTRVRRALAAWTAQAGARRFPELLVSLPHEPRPGELLTHVLREVTGRPDVLVALSFGPPRPNRKPVAQVLTPEGDVLAFAKIGWSGATDELLLAETETVRRWDARRPSTFAVPRLVHTGRLWNGRVFTVFEPMPTSVRPERRPGSLPPLEAVREIAAAGGVGLGPLAGSSFWRRLLERASATPFGTRPVASLALRWVDDLHARRLVWLGSWHGDWAPQNMSTVGGRLHVWDWERSADGVPLGLDVLHFHFHVALRRRRNVAWAAELARRRALPSLHALGVPDEDVPILLVAYLAELLLRFEEGRDAGARVRAGMPEALLGELQRWAGRV